jgi:hypothetical protein
VHPVDEGAVVRRRRKGIACINHTFLKKLFFTAHRGPNRGQGAKHLVCSVCLAPCPLGQTFNESECEVSGRGDVDRRRSAGRRERHPRRGLVDHDRRYRRRDSDGKTRVRRHWAVFCPSSSHSPCECPPSRKED